MCGLVAYSSFQTSALPLAWVSARRVGGLACTASGAGSWELGCYRATRKRAGDRVFSVLRTTFRSLLGINGIFRFSLIRV